MRKFFTAIALSLAAAAGAAPLGVFNHLGAGVGVGTTGVSVELTTPITSFVTMRGGVSVMPGITFNTDADYTATIAGQEHNSTVDLEGNLKRVQGQIIFNVYPVPVVPFYVAAGAYFGGDKVVKISGNLDPEIVDAAATNGSIIIGDQEIPTGPNGEISGGIKVNSFRPYIGLGWGRVLPGKLLSFSTELGVQIHGTPKLYTDYGTISDTIGDFEDDNTFNKIKDKVKVYPTLTFRLNFKAF